MKMFLRTHIAGAAGIALFGIVLFLVIPHLPVRGSYVEAGLSTSTGVAQATDPMLPIRLIIPSINVNAAIESVGLTPAGAMNAPKGPADAAWFDLGPRPGDIGNAVIDGHFGWKDNIPAVFDNLAKLQIGDKIYVETAKGTTIVFVVREVLTYDQNADARSVFNSNDGKAHLNLITCEGVWNAASKSYSNRLVVFADKA